MAAARGLSLVEFLVGVALLVGAVGVVLGLFPIAYGSLLQARDTTAAMHLGRQVLDRSRATPFRSLSNVTGATVEVASEIDGAAEVTRFTYDLTFASSKSQLNEYYEACVTIRWGSDEKAGTSGALHSMRLDTVISNR